MKTKIQVIFGATCAALLMGCASAPVALAPVGPNPAAGPGATANGQLEVFSALVGRTEGENPTWRQHTDYYVCDSRGRRLQHVENTIGYYAQAPRLVTLPAGRYVVEAWAKYGQRMNVPVVIKPGKTTKVHLDDKWQPPAGTAKMELVRAPSGYDVGWRAE